MCGRVTLRRPARVRLQRLDTRALFDELPRYNIAPTQGLWVVTEANEERSLSLLQWGLIPSWSKEPAGFINARAETLETKPSFRESFLKRRCLIPADGFYEWVKTTLDVPFNIELRTCNYAPRPLKQVVKGR